ncbi:MAG: lysozyme inhibitor LprI family protein [Pseudomonadales bacterium]
MIALNSCKARLRLACIFFIAVWGVLLGVAWSTVAVAETVPASFDCKKASKTVEKFICSQAVLRWNDWALARSYRAVYAAAKKSAREHLVFEQRDWMRERDRRCVAE